LNGRPAAESQSIGPLSSRPRRYHVRPRFAVSTRIIVWKLGPPTLAGQHAPTPLENGNILIFDNGVHRLDDPLPFSRVIEVDPATNEIGWTYQDRPVSNFFSPRMGNAQRLPNGNTLINEASFARFFEVTRDGEIVWEYVYPYFGWIASG